MTYSDWLAAAIERGMQEARRQIVAAMQQVELRMIEASIAAQALTDAFRDAADEDWRAHWYRPGDAYWEDT